jgi:formamidopyrimidine-DNA glycosylase
MPELPEVECVRLALREWIVGRRVLSVRVRRRDVVRGECTREALLVGRRVAGVERLGKQLALFGSGGVKSGANDERWVCIHLGMSGTLRCLRQHEMGREVGAGGAEGKHVHVVWELEGGVLLEYRDPRRFGGVWTFAGRGGLWEARWGSLGPDALRITAEQLHERLGASRRAVKAALLDQSVVAGLGNIYVDELLYRCGIHPKTPSGVLGIDRLRVMVGEMRLLLRGAIRSGGSSVRDYVDAKGRRGWFQVRHEVYGRAGQLCGRCGQRLRSMPVGGRTTVYCPRCQKRVSVAR